jgi:hypothetical protein
MLPQWQSHLIKPKTGPEDPELQEILNEALTQLSPQDLIQIADEMAARHRQLFRPLRTNPHALVSGFAEIASAVTYTRGQAQTLVRFFSHGDYTPLIEALSNPLPAEERVAAFVERSGDLEPALAIELVSGVLHNTFPESCWWWTRWLWNPRTASGILPLLAGSTHNLLSEDLAEAYRRVGTVTAMSVHVAEETGLWTEELVKDEQRRPFAATVFLACMYCVYLYGTTGWRLSREFHSLLPRLPDMVRRLLGLKKGSSRIPSAAEQTLNA